MKTIIKPRTLGILFSLLFLCSCATQDTIRPPVLAETSFNQEAGRGGLLLVSLNLESGEELLFVVDTGSPFCALDKTLESRLGNPLKNYQIHSMYGATPSKLYKAPKLYLNKIPLKTGDTVAVMDFKRLSDDLNQLAHSSHRIMGILGMECLRHYCIQLDFVDKKLRLLNSNHPGDQDLGKTFPLTISHGPYLIVRGSLAGGNGTSSMIDTGMTFDGDVSQKPFRQQQFFSKYSRTNVVFKNGVFGGYSYTNLCLGDGHANVLGLGFISRNLVTFNFPKRTMYLKRQNVGPLD